MKGGCDGHSHSQSHNHNLDTETELDIDCCDDALIYADKNPKTICMLTEDAAFQAKLKKGNSAMSKLRCVLMISFFFMIVEIVGGLISNSLAILTDAAHMASDIAGFVISMFSIWISQKPSNSKSSFGYHRAEVLGGLTSILTIWILVIYLNIEAVYRMMDQSLIDIDASVMLITSFISLLCNIFSLIVLDHCKVPCYK